VVYCREQLNTRCNICWSSWRDSNLCFYYLTRGAENGLHVHCDTNQLSKKKTFNHLMILCIFYFTCKLWNSVPQLLSSIDCTEAEFGSLNNPRDKNCENSSRVSMQARKLQLHNCGQSSIQDNLWTAPSRWNHLWRRVLQDILSKSPLNSVQRKLRQLQPLAPACRMWGPMRQPHVLRKLSLLMVRLNCMMIIIWPHTFIANVDDPSPSEAQLICE
jgi:hypothetical protein